jgi:hypothetical protein
LCVTYWLHLPEHTDIKTEGYVWVTNDIDRRLSEHVNYPSNDILEQVIPANVDRLVMDIVSEDDERACMKMERDLRPQRLWRLVHDGA